jgi:hypothetical protein
MAKGKAKRGAALAGRGLMAVAKHRLPSAAWGAGAAYLVKFSAPHIQAVREKIWGGPAVVFAASLLNVTKNQMHGHALAGAAGMLLGYNYMAQQYQNGKGEPLPINFVSAAPAAGAPAAAPGAQGYDDTGLRQEPDAGLIMN